MTDLFAKLNAAEAAYEAFGFNVSLDQLDACFEALRALEDARCAYYSAIRERKAVWDTLRGENRGSAIDNAYDTEGTDTDELYWLEIAIRSYDD